MLYTSEQFATKENVVQDATDRRVQREVPSIPNKHQSGKEQKRAEPQLVEKCGPTAGENKPESARL